MRAPSPRSGAIERYEHVTLVVEQSVPPPVGSAEVKAHCVSKWFCRMPPENVTTPTPFFAIDSPASFASDGENGMSPNEPEVYAFEIRQLWPPKELGALGTLATTSWSMSGLMGMPGGFWPPQPFCPCMEPGE